MNNYAYMEKASVYTKIQRQEIIRKVVTEGEIHKQEDLITALRAEGLDITQSTLSRDMKEMKIVRLHDKTGGYVYSLLSSAQQNSDVPFAKIPKVSVRSIEFSSLFAVIKTAPGFASAVAALIDSNDIQGVMGTIAGDDTILVMIKDGFSKKQIITNMSQYIDGIA